MRHQIWLSVALLAALIPFNIKELIWTSGSLGGQSEASIEVKAFIAGMSIEEFELISSIVEAESDRKDSIEGKRLIALTILNRRASDKFPNSIKGVISESGQFTTYEQGIHRQTGRTDTSDEAVIEATFWFEKEHPNVIYFNCIGYNHLGTPYDYVDGNYFETLEE